MLNTSLKSSGVRQRGQRLQQLRLSEEGDRVPELNDRRPWLVRPEDDKMMVLRNPAYNASGSVMH
jgi:hypothetical protein